jgi:hypothetical protein
MKTCAFSSLASSLFSSAVFVVFVVADKTEIHPNLKE